MFGVCAGGHVRAWRAPPASQAAAHRHTGRPTAPGWPAWCCRPSCRGLKMGRGRFLSIRMVARIAVKTVASPACTQIFLHMSPPLDPLARFSTQNLGGERSHGTQNKALSKGQNAEGRVWCVHRRPHMCPGDLAAPQAAAHGHIGRAAGPGWQLGGALGRPEAAEKGLWAFSVHLHNSRNCGKTCARIRAHPNFFAYIAPI